MIDKLREAIAAVEFAQPHKPNSPLGIVMSAARLVLAAQSAGSAVEAGAQALCQYEGNDWTDEPTRDDYRADVRVVLRAAALSGTVERGAVTEEDVIAVMTNYLRVEQDKNFIDRFYITGNQKAAARIMALIGRPQP